MRTTLGVEQPIYKSKNTNLSRSLKRHHRIKCIHTRGSKHQLEKETEASRDFVEIQDQTFPCIKEQTSDASATPLLKIIEFL